jgi:cation diffusion facilitator family transporter
MQLKTQLNCVNFLETMGKNCCDHDHDLHSDEKPLVARQRKALLLALLVNLGVLGFEVWGGITAHSEAILADAVHLFSHVLVILLSLAALKKGTPWKARAAVVKGLLVCGLGLNILVEALYALLDPNHLPEPKIMSMVAVAALLGNIVTLWIMASHRNEDLNMRSTWVCSQADLMTNLGLIAASVLVTVLQAGWPDGVLGLALGLLVTRSAVSVLKQAYEVMKRGEATESAH